MLREMASLGFDYAELSHGIRITLVPGILKAVEEGVIKISSTHNFCPLPTGITQAATNLFEPSALDPREHEQWVRQTKRSLDFASQVGARVLVLHLGSVPFPWFNPGRKIHAYAEAHPGERLIEDKKYCTLRDNALVKLLRKMPPYWARVKESLEEIRAHAVEKKIRLGLENRERFEELPVDDDFQDLFASLSQPNTAGYWHDTGHAQLKENLGLINHREQLEKNARSLVGFHLHDVADGEDHQPIGSGMVNFKMVSSFWKPEHTLVLEFSPRLTTEEVKLSKTLVDNWCGGS